MIHAADSTLFGRARDIIRIENALADSATSGVIIEGETGMGKSRLVGELHRRRGGTEVSVRGDRILRSTPYGAFGLHVDLDRDTENMLPRVVRALSEGSGTPVVFADDTHDLDESSLEMLWQLLTARQIKLVATVRPTSDGRELPFNDLVADEVVDHIVLGALSPTDFRKMVRHHLGGVVSQGVIDVVGFHSNRVPGKLVELLRYTNRKNRCFDRRGVWLLDGLDTDYDERARDITRVDLARFSAAERGALELVALAGEVDVELMLAAGLGGAADTMARIGELGVEQRSRQVYVATGNHATETIRQTVPIGRSRRMFDLVDEHEDAPNERSWMLRVQWGLSCGARVSAQDTLDAARIALRLGEWLRALRIITELDTDNFSAHELLDLGRLFCAVNRVPIGLDVIARAVKEACCPAVVLEALVIWVYRDAGRTSPTLNADDFRSALIRLDEQGNSHPVPNSGSDRAREIFELVEANYFNALPDDDATITRWMQDQSVPETLRVAIAHADAERKLERGAVREAIRTIDEVGDLSRYLGTSALMSGITKARAYLQAGKIAEATSSLRDDLSYDLAFLAALSGPRDLIWARIHLEEGRLPEAMNASRAAVEAIMYWNQHTYMAIALAQAEYVSMLSGNVEMADDYDLRLRSLPASGTYVEQRTARGLHLVARIRLTEEPSFLAELHDLLDEVEGDGALHLAALIRIELFRHVGDVDPDQMCRLGAQKSERSLRFVHALGTALRDRDASALAEVAESVAATMPDLAERCRTLARSYSGSGRGRTIDSKESGAMNGNRLTGRELQISRSIIAGMANSEIASDLGVSVRTVEGHTYRLYRKLDISRRDQVAEALEQTSAGPSNGAGPLSDAEAESPREEVRRFR